MSRFGGDHRPQPIRGYRRPAAMEPAATGAPSASQIATQQFDYFDGDKEKEILGVEAAGVPVGGFVGQTTLAPVAEFVRPETASGVEWTERNERDVEENGGVVTNEQPPERPAKDTDEPVVPFTFYANKALVAARRIWHAYIFFSAAVSVLAIAVSLQLHAFFQFFSGSFPNYGVLALNILLSLTIAAFLALFITVLWDLVRSAWSGAEFLHIRKLLFAVKAPRPLAIAWDAFAQTLIVGGLDILPIVLGAYYFVVEGFYGIFIGFFGTGLLAALTFGTLIFSFEMINALISLIIALFRLLSCASCSKPNGNSSSKKPNLLSLRARTERAGFEISRTVTTIATKPSLEYWFCYTVLVRFAGSSSALFLYTLLSIIGLAVCGLATKFDDTTWMWISEAVFLFLTLFLWLYARIWASAIRLLKLRLRERAPHLIKKTDGEQPDSKSITDLAGENHEFGTLSNPIGRWYARTVEPALPPAWDHISIFQPFANKVNITLVAWMALSVLVLLGWTSYLLGRANWIASVANIYLAVPFIVLVLLYTFYMRPRTMMAEELAAAQTGQFDFMATRKFYRILRGVQISLYLLIPAILLIGVLIWFLATRSTAAGATIGFSIMYFLLGALVIFAFRFLARGFPTEAFLFSFGFLLFLFLLIFATATTYSGVNEGKGEVSSNATVGPILSTADPLPYCDLDVYGLKIVDLSLFANLAYSGPKFIAGDLANWFPRWTLAANRTTDPLLWFYEFSEGNLSVVAVRGTQSAVDWMTNLDLWAQVGILQIADFFVPLLRVWPEGWSSLVVYFTSPSYFLGKEVEHWQPLLAHVEKLRQEGRRVVLTGHSLGAGLANIVGTRTRTRSVTFAPPGIFHSRLKFGIDESQDLDRALISVVVRNDVVSMIDKQSGSLAYLPCGRFPLICHSMTRIAVKFQEACGDPLGRVFGEGRKATGFWGADG